MIEFDCVKIFRYGLLKLIGLSGQLKSGEQIADDNERLVGGTKGSYSKAFKKATPGFRRGFFYELN